jgi:hypothetical protein
LVYPALRDCVASPNFQIREQKLFLDFKNPWKILLKYNAESRRGEAGLVQNSSQNPKSENWRCLLGEVRTFFEQNPDIDI